MLSAPSAALAPPSQSAQPRRNARVLENYGRLPLSFEANAGQADKIVKFLSRAGGYGLYLTTNEAALVIQDSGVSTAVLRMRLVGANAEATVVGEDELAGKHNYFIANDPRRWHASVPIYAKVRYRGVYPGIDLIYHGSPSAHGQLELDFAVAPGADPGTIALQIVREGSGLPRATEGRPYNIALDGDLVIHTRGGEVRFRKPVAYQVPFRVDNGRGGAEKEQGEQLRTHNPEPVDARFTLLAGNQIGFEVRSYDKRRPLIIDPVLAFSTFLGSGDTGNAIVVDSAGDAYVAGETCLHDFPVTRGAYQATNHAPTNPGCTAFVTELSPSGTALVYSTYLGGSGGDVANAIAVDTAGNAYVTGRTSSTDFPVTPGALQTTNHAAANSTSNAFVTKLNSTGSALVYSTYLGGTGVSVETIAYGDTGNAIAVDAAENAYVAGQAASADFPTTPGAFQATNHAAALPAPNAFVAKLKPAGTALGYSTYLGGSGGGSVNEGDVGNAIAVDSAGDAFVTGATSSVNFPVTRGAFQTTGHGGNVFISKLSPAGTALIYSTYLGGSTGSAIAVDATGSAYVAGSAGSDFPVTAGAFQTAYPGAANSSPNAFVTKLNAAGTALVYSTYLGGSGGVLCYSPTLLLAPAGDRASGLAIDSSGNAYVTGTTVSPDFPVTPDAYQPTNHDQIFCSGQIIGGYNAFITELNSAGSALVYSTYLGGSGTSPAASIGPVFYSRGDFANGLALDDSGNVYVTGSTPSYDFPVTWGSFDTTFSGGAFIAKLDMGAVSTATTPTVTVTPAASTITSGQRLAVTISVSGGTGNPAPTGTVTLASGTYASAATTLSTGSATISIRGASLVAEPGTLPHDPLVADYVPDTASSSTYKFSSGEGSVAVAAAGFSVTPSSTVLTWAQSQSQSLAVAVAATPVVSGLPVPTGTVTLTTGSYSSAATALSGGDATITIPPATLPGGFDILDLSYSGDSNYAPAAVAGSALLAVGTPNGVFTIAGTPVTLTAGATTGDVSTITVKPSGGFIGDVALTAAVTSSPSGAQSPPTLSFGSTSPVTITSVYPGTAALTISTTAPGTCSQVYQTPGGIFWYIWGGAALVCVLLLGMQARRRRWRAALATLALLLALTGGLLACGGASPTCTPTPGTTPGIYTITVTGASGTTTATGTLTLTVQ